MAKWNPATDEARFREDAAIGDRWVQKVAQRLIGLGLWTVTVPPSRIRTQFDDRGAYRDDGDLFLNGHRIEVRSLGTVFRGPDSYPFRTIQVELAKVLPHKNGVVAYLFVSRATSAVIGLHGCDLRRLDPVAGVYNVRRGVARDWLVAPSVKLVTFEAAVNYLADRCSENITGAGVA
jgi:hypothetical protein